VGDLENVSLFATCALPGCRNDVAEWGDVCTECIAAAGDYLRPTTGPKLTEDEIHDRDLATREDRRAQRRIAAAAVESSDQPERKQNQMLHQLHEDPGTGTTFDRYRCTVSASCSAQHSAW
jgi:hypothetical protein